jgi:hypothetical protein
MKSIGIALIALLMVVSVPMASANAAPCEGCENWQGQQYCNPFEPDFRFEHCEVQQGFCQMQDRCDPVMAYNEFDVPERIGPGGTYLPISSKVASSKGRLVNTCTGYIVAEQEFDAVPSTITI